jgi:sugar/nucleoside kinase (ribokinase family)
LEDYLTHLITLYRDEKMPDDVIFDIFTRTRAKAVLEGSETHDRPEFLLFGASAYLTEIQCDEIPAPGAVSSCSSPNRYPGGTTADLASTLAEGGHRVTFVSSVGNDQDGWRVISDLIGKGVDVADFVVETGKSTNESLIVRDKRGERTMVGIGESTSLSITSPSQIPWVKATNSSIIYIGEVFLEVAVSITAYARSHDIPVVYRPSIPYLEMGLEATEPVFKQVDLLLLSARAWQYLRLHYGPRPIERIHGITDATILVKKSKKTYSIHPKGKRQKTVQCQRPTTDISSPFMMGLLQGLKNRLDLVESVNLGIGLEQQQE